MLDVYLDPCTINCRKVLAGLDLMQAPYNEKFISYFEGQQKSAEYMKINPNATIPAAVDDDLIITESNAILQYAADVNNSPAYPKDLKKRADVNRWLLWEASVWFQTCYVYMVENVVKPLLKAEPDQAVLAAEEPKFKKLAGILDAQLAKSPWITGDAVTIADIALASPMHLHAAAKLPLDDFAHLKRWMTEAVEKLPAWQKTQAAVDKALLPGATASHSVTSHGPADPKEVRTNFNYTRDVDQLTELYFYEDEKARHIHAPGDDPHEMTVHNGWDQVDAFSLDRNGFSVHDFHTDYDAWDEEDQVRHTFYPEVVAFLKQTTGARRILVFDHTIRTASNAAKKLTDEKSTSQRAPVMLVHCDYTAESGPVRVRQLLDAEADDLLSRRVAFYNVWKPIHRVVEERPLAMCDVASSPSDDFFKLYLRYRDRTGENYVMRHAPTHKWWYFPQMTPEQVIILKTYESEQDGRARFVGHSAMEDPTTPAHAPMRESVEIRTIAFF